MKHVAAIAIIKDGKMLMGKRKDNGKWTNPGGHLNEGEDPVVGAIREVKEETGLELDSHQLSSLGNTIVNKGKIRVYGYVVHLAKEQPTTIKQDPDDEVHRWVWANISDNKNPAIFNNLHVPKGNILLDELDIKFEKKAFYTGFEKQATLSKALRGGYLHPYKNKLKNIRTSMGSRRLPAKNY